MALGGAVREAEPAGAGVPTEEKAESSSWFARMYPALTVAPYRLLWFGTLPAHGAQAMSQVAVGYAAFQLTGSATSLGLVSLAGGLPAAFLTPFGGVVADRFPRRRVMLVTQSLLLVTSLLMALLMGSGQLQIWHLAVLAMVQNSCFAFNAPSRQAMMGELVPPRMLNNAVALTSTGVSTARVVGPSIAGVILALPQGAAAVFGTMTALYAGVLAALLRLNRYTKESEASFAGKRSDRNPMEELKEGFLYIVQSPVVRVLMLMGLVPVLLSNPLQQLMPVFSERVFDSGSVGLGTLSAFLGGGSLIGSLVAAPLASNRRPVLVQIVVGCMLAGALALFALAPSFWVGCAALLAVGFGQSCYTSLNTAQIMTSTEPRLHGRVMSVNMVMFFIVPVVAFPLAWLCDVIGPRITVAGCGLAILLCMAAVARFRRSSGRAA